MIKAASEAIKQKFPEEVLGTAEHGGQLAIEVRPARIREILRTLRDEFSFDCLADLSALDYSAWSGPPRPERYAVVYELYSFERHERLRVRALVPESEPSIDSVHDLWKSADWAEREAWDMMGIKFTGHPDLRRILLPDDYKSYPLRKEYPVTGLGERDAFPKYFE